MKIICNETTIKRSRKQAILKYHEVYFELKNFVNKALSNWNLSEEKKTELIKSLEEMETEYQKVKSLCQ